MQSVHVNVSIGARLRAGLHRVFGSPEHDRLEGGIRATWIAFDSQIHQSGPQSLTEPWARMASRYLAEANDCLQSGQAQQGWIALTAAQRALLCDPSAVDQIQRIAIALRRETAKVSGWRAKAINDLICDSKGDLLPNLKDDPKRVIDAIALRDDQFQTTYFKIGLRRRHLGVISAILWVSIALCLLVSFLKVLPSPFNDIWTVAAVVVLGALGAGVSVGQELLSAEVSAKVPEQKMRAFVVWMRPAIGSTAALVALVLLSANDTIKLFAWNADNFGGVLAVAFAAGFSERFIVGAVGRLTAATKDDSDK
jgi:hypothetical protein